MAKVETARLKPGVRKADRDALAALQAIANYAPVNPAYTVAAVAEAYEELLSAQAAETQANVDADAARDRAAGKEWKFHNLILGVRLQVTAQFGKDSNEAQALGLKKPSEYKARRRKPKSEES